MFYLYNICMRNKIEMERKNFYLTKKQAEELEKDANRNGITFSEMLRRVLDKFIQSREIL